MRIPDDVKSAIQEYNEKEPSMTDNVVGGFIRNQNGGIKKLLHNIRIMIGLEPDSKKIGFNEFTQEITFDNEPITDIYIDKLRVKFDQKYQIKFSSDDILTVLRVFSRENSYHPVKDFIESKDWDKTPRAETVFIDYLGADDNSYIRNATMKWLAGSVARIYEPGVKFEMVPILQGKQGIGKSTIAQKLGGEYFTDTLKGLGKTKDDYQMLVGTWIVELGELASMNSTETETIKNFISAKEDKIRLPYSRITETFKRTVSFIGTTNPGEYLTDLTGNRRFFPIPTNEDKVTKDVFELDKETVQQIWAEAYIYYIAGEKLFLDDKEDEALANEYRNQATESNSLVSDIEDFLNMPVPFDWNTRAISQKRTYFENYQDDGSIDGKEEIVKTSANEILKVVFDTKNNDRQQKSLTKQIKLYMETLDNWEKKQVKINGRNMRGYKKY